MFELVIVKGESRESVWFIIRFDEVEFFFTLMQQVSENTASYVIYVEQERMLQG